MKIEIVSETGCTSLAYNQPVLLSTVFAAHGVPLDMPCGGRQRCLKCKVRATGALSPMSERERSLLTEEEQRQHVRYACMTQAQGDVCVELPRRNATDRILLQGTMPFFEPSPWGEQYGVAVDIGTTTVAAYLYDLQTSVLLETATMRNPQTRFGADVISRIEKALAGEGSVLAEAIRTGVTQLLDQLCTARTLPLTAIDAVVLTGNTAMLYLLCDQNPASIASAPFEQDRWFGEFLPPSALSLPLKESARVYLPRCISAYVGADITTALLAAGFNANGKPAELPTTLLVDIGTNGEMVLVHNGTLYGCSTAAGPAFEGAGIYRGMNALSGAISEVKLENGLPHCQVLGGGEAKGLCGSGIVDAVAALLEAGVLDETGLLLDAEEEHPLAWCLTEVNGQPAFRLPDTGIDITQADIRAVQLAKAALCAGMVTLMGEAGVAPEEVKHLLIAGGFGSYINVRSAERIGLIPDGFASKATAIGNAAGAGASMVLLSDPLRRDSERLAPCVQTLELSSSAPFMDNYVNAMLFPSAFSTPLL